jgi:hypothetical protein
MGWYSLTIFNYGISEQLITPSNFDPVFDDLKADDLIGCQFIPLNRAKRPGWSKKMITKRTSINLIGVFGKIVVRRLRPMCMILKTSRLIILITKNGARDFGSRGIECNARICL